MIDFALRWITAYSRRFPLNKREPVLFMGLQKSYVERDYEDLMKVKDSLPESHREKVSQVTDNIYDYVLEEYIFDDYSVRFQYNEDERMVKVKVFSTRNKQGEIAQFAHGSGLLSESELEELTRAQNGFSSSNPDLEDMLGSMPRGSEA